jgi:hypothetical protein
MRIDTISRQLIPYTEALCVPTMSEKLSQPPRIWHRTLATYLLGLGFKQLLKDRCVFIARKNGHVCIVSAYVDDPLIIGNLLSVVNKFKQQVSQKFTITDLGEAELLLGWHIRRDRERETPHLH